MNTLNKEFQSETCKVDVLLIRLTELYKTFLRNFINKKYLDETPIHQVCVENPHNFIKIENMYFGANVEQIIEIEPLDKNELSKFRTNALGFYVELCKQIKNELTSMNLCYYTFKSFRPMRFVLVFIFPSQKFWIFFLN